VTLPPTTHPDPDPAAERFPDLGHGAGPAAAGGAPSRPSGRRPLRWAGAGAAVGVTVLGLAAGWLTWTALQARAELAAARTALPGVQAAVLVGAGTAGGQLAELSRHAARADDLTHDPVWSLAGAVPLVGSPVATVAGMTRSVHVLARQGLPDLARAADALHPARLLRGGGRLDVAALAAAEPSLATAAGSLRQQRDAVAALDPSWLGPVRTAHAQLLASLVSLAGTSRDAATAARVLPPMLGLGGPRRYFVAFQNPAEARGTGGLLDAYAIVVADHGAVRIERMGANTQLPPFSGEVADVDPAFADRYAALGGTSAWLEANVSPDFPDVARVWEAMWLKATGQQLDGAVALDPRALAAVLDGIGPVTAPVVGAVDARRIEPLVLHDQYLLTPLVAQRKSLMLGVGSAAADKLLGGGVSPSRLLPRLRDVASAGHVLVQSRHPAEQARLLGAGIGGAVDGTDRPFAQAVVVNAAGNKLDSWLDTSLRYQVTGCAAQARTVSITVTLRNDAPTTGLPPYMTVRSDRPPYPTVPGQNRSELNVLVTRGARLVGASLDGAPLLASGQDDTLPDTMAADAADTFLGQGEVAGRPAYWVDLETRPGGTHTMVLRLTEPASTRPPLLPRQTLVRGPEVTADVRACQG
jgi:Protein of unknown function (DUF4012)